MENENKVLEGQQSSVTSEVVDGNADYLEAIKTLKQNSVDKAEYDKLKADNKRLLDAVINGSTDEDEPETTEVTKQERQRWMKEQMQPIEYWDTYLKMRKADIESGKGDDMLAAVKVPTDEQRATADKVAEAIASCIEMAEGDNEIFMSEFNRIFK